MRKADRPGLRSRSQVGFTVIELMLTIALLVTVSAVLVPNFDMLVKAFSQDSLENSLSKALREVRYQAKQRSEAMRLLFDKEEAAFLIYSKGGLLIAQVATHFAPDTDPLEVTIKPVLPDEDDDGKFRHQVSDEILEFIRVHPTGVATPVQIDLLAPDEHQQLMLDPFSTGLLPKQDA